MNEDEIELVAALRPEVAPYDTEARLKARGRLLAAGRRDARGPRAGRPPVRRPAWRGPYARVLAGALAVAAGATVIVLTGAPVDAPAPGTSAGRETVTGTGGRTGGETVAAMPRFTVVSASEVLDRAARAASRTDLAPRDDQFVKVESQTMYGAFGEGAVNVETGRTTGQTRYLYRTRRTIWLSADGTRDGVLRVEHLEPRAYPGWPVPPSAYEETGVKTMPLVSCGGLPDHARTDHAALRRLPTDPEGMRAHLYTGDRGGESKDEAAFTAAGDMLRETYMPPAQRAALFKAVGTIPGVEATGRAPDAAGREGVGVGRVGLDGVRHELIFDSETYELLGERGIVVDAKAAGSPVGSLVASTAQLSVGVADEAPGVEEVGAEEKKAGCGGGG
ncbi:CU044_5270 family protein [Streptosporangium sp. NPDC050855]|uniref:CU044_5270 family protein n=1 Tax=Streptosporangium sp. NPDC050855 TaxID=3366194 RepID=UPI0037B9B762